jgi:hypothetical protein
MDMQISLLQWPPQRLVRESILNHNLRHPEAPLDAEKSDWADIVPVIYAFVRHELTNYDAELRVEGIYDEDKRNALAARVAARARTAFPWLKQDPRPFPKPPKGLELDDAARRLANLRTREYHLLQVLADIRDSAWKKELKKELDNCRQKIENFTIPFKVTPPSEADKYVGAYSRKTDTGTDYDWFGHRFDHFNYLEFVGFTCPVCRVSVLQTKRAVSLGQGRKRFLVSCHCVCVAMERFMRLKSKRWEEILRNFKLLEPSPPEKPS